TRRAGTDRFEDAIVALMHREHDDGDRRMALPDYARALGAAATRQNQIHQDKPRNFLAIRKNHERAFAIGERARHAEARMTLDQVAQRFTVEGVIFDEPNGSARFVCWNAVGSHDLNASARSGAR